MRMRLSSALVTAALFCTADPAISPVWSKPPDLPLNTRDTCEPRCRIGSAQRCEDLRSAREQRVNGSVEASEAIDVTTPLLLETVEQIFRAFSGIYSPNPVEETPVQRESHPLYQDRKERSQNYRTNEQSPGTSRGAVRPVNSGAAPFRTHLRGRRDRLVAQCGTEHMGCRAEASYHSARTSRSHHYRQSGQNFVSVVMSASSCSAIGGVAQWCVPHIGDEQYQQLRAATRLYEIGLRCQGSGDRLMARSCFEEVTRMCPNSDIARLAATRLASVIAGTSEGGVETQEDPMPEDRQDLIRETRADLHRIRESHHMYQRGTRFEANGNVVKAMRCFHEAYMICPACQYGRMAMERLTALDEIKGQQGGAEEQEPPLNRKVRWSDEQMDRREQARELYRLGERCRVGGDQRMAHAFYQESCLACPECYHGVRAFERMQVIESQRRLYTEAPASRGTPSSRQVDPRQVREQRLSDLWEAQLQEIQELMQRGFQFGPF